MDRFPNGIPPPDRRKPKLPYRRGLKVQITRHIPPPPFGHGYVREATRRGLLSFNELAKYPTASQYCLENPYPSTEPHPNKTVHTLEIVDVIAAEDGRGPQLVACRLHYDIGPLFVAKIYDPLYYDWFSCDNIWLADYEYSREAAAYARAEQAGIDGVYIPEYHGCWVFSMPFLGKPVATREVRMIL
ncbi:hypothetical protein VTK73DRAFT_8997 [Phialemonium thermophilum]|uniref:Uncharacterized protein n=1 Tax=Phialemonium thermophilum TaxID=223376 RepID=A0ABR3W5C0_9PEZI